jgi:hypothetical protein
MGLDPGHVVHIEPCAPSRLDLQLEADMGYWPSIADALDDLVAEASINGGPIISGFIRRADGAGKRSVDVQLRSDDALVKFSITTAMPVGSWSSALVRGRLRDSL